MTEQAKAAQREYMRRWRAANKDRVKAATEAYWERVAAEYEKQNAADREQKK